jgi:hypothetical protein
MKGGCPFLPPSNHAFASSSHRLPFRSTRPICCSKIAGFHSAWNWTTTRHDSCRLSPSLPTWLCATRTHGDAPRRLNAAWMYRRVSQRVAPCRSRACRLCLIRRLSFLVRHEGALF